MQHLKLFNPREVVQAAEDAYRTGHAPLEAVEGFVRQILGWREYVRGIYWTQMPDYVKLNALDAQAPLPAFYSTGETDMVSLKDAITQTLAHGTPHGAGSISRIISSGSLSPAQGLRQKT